MARVKGYFDTKAADQIYSNPFTDEASHVHQPDVELSEIDFVELTRYPSPFLCWTSAIDHYWLHSTPDTAMATGPTALCLLVLRRSLRDACRIPDFHATLRVSTQLCAIAPGKTATTRTCRADHAEYIWLEFLKTGRMLSTFILLFI